jgi:tetrahedral aminopeptidase
MLLQQLAELSGPSSYEDEVRQYIKKELLNVGLQPSADALGNVFATKGSGKVRVLLTAHMDEVGLMITGIEKNGLLKFQTLGGIDLRFLVSKNIIIGSKKTLGVIGAKAIHLQEPEEREQALKLKDLFIDIGAKNKEDALKYISLGDFAVLHSEFLDKEKVYIGKAFDDRAGCAELLEILKEDFPCTIHAAFTVQEEVGLRGAMVAAQHFESDFAIVLETTAAYDTRDEKYLSATMLHKGPALTVIDARTVASKELTDRIAKIAELNNIPYQYRGSANGGNDAGSIHISREGIPTAIVSLPCRYIHTPYSMISKEDLCNTVNLLKIFLKSL